MEYLEWTEVGVVTHIVATDGEEVVRLRAENERLLAALENIAHEYRSALRMIKIKEQDSSTLTTALEALTRYRSLTT